MLSGLVGCGFLSGETCSVVAVGNFAGGDGGLSAACGIMAVNWMAQGIFQAEKVRAGIPGGWILAGGVIGYVVLLVISNIVFHRMRRYTFY